MAAAAPWAGRWQGGGRAVAWLRAALATTAVPRVSFCYEQRAAGVVCNEQATGGRTPAWRAEGDFRIGRPARPGRQGSGGRVLS